MRTSPASHTNTQIDKQTNQQSNNETNTKNIDIQQIANNQKVGQICQKGTQQRKT
jgi:hypothetical protein